MPDDITYKTADGATVKIGDRVYNYYDRVPGTIARDGGDGWFDFTGDDGRKTLLDGDRVCTLAFAARKGWK